MANVRIDTHCSGESDCHCVQCNAVRADERSRGRLYTETRVPLRDYFAARALEGMMLAAADSYLDADEIAEDAYTYADAMIEVRKKNVKDT